MRQPVVTALRVVLGMVLLGSVFVQAVMVPLMAIDLEEADPSSASVQVPFAITMILIIGTAQVFTICIWRLVTMVSANTVFSTAAFRYVDVMVRAALAATALIFLLGVLLAPGDAVAPGVVLLLGGAAVVAAGIGLTVQVLRTLLAQAIDREVQVTALQAELDEVI